MEPTFTITPNGSSTVLVGMCEPHSADFEVICQIHRDNCAEYARSHVRRRSKPPAFRSGPSREEEPPTAAPNLVSEGWAFAPLLRQGHGYYLFGQPTGDTAGIRRATWYKVPPN